MNPKPNPKRHKSAQAQKYSLNPRWRRPRAGKTGEKIPSRKIRGRP